MPDPYRWSTSLPDRQLAPDAVHVWRVALRVDTETVDALHSVLSPDESQRAACYRFERDRQAFIVARGALRFVLGRYMNRSPEDIHFGYGAHGKPELVDMPDLQFNLSHAGDVALIAVARERALGVDVEPVRALPDADAIVGRFFSPLEVAVYRSLPEPARPEAFFTCWTRKEAFIKALGDGLTFPLGDFDVTVHPDEPALLLGVRDVAPPPEWHLRALPVDPGYVATVAVEGPPCTITYGDARQLMSSLAVA